MYQESRLNLDDMLCQKKLSLCMSLLDSWSRNAQRALQASALERTCLDDLYSTARLVRAVDFVSHIKVKYVKATNDKDHYWEERPILRVVVVLDK